MREVETNLFGQIVLRQIDLPNACIIKFRGLLMRESNIGALHTGIEYIEVCMYVYT